MVECRIPGHITGLYIFAVVNLCALLNISLVSADVFVIDVDKNSTIDVIQDKQAMFGPDFPAEGLVGRLVYVIPHDACNRVTPPPPEPSEKDLPWIALIKRGPCHFDLKVLNAQTGNFSAAIVHNSVGDNSLVQMAGGQYADKVKIPSVFVGFDNGMALAHRYNYTHKSIVIKILESSDQAPASFFLPFVVVVSICFLGVVIFSIIKCVKYFQHIRRTRLSKSALKKIPTRKYMKGDHYDTCAICLEDYEEGEKLRVLPCDHTYHCKCIDPWLTKRKKTCPQCKRRVIPGQDTDSDSDEEEAAAAAPASETTPLLGGSNNHQRHQRRLGPSSSGRQSRLPTGQQASVTPDTTASPSDLPAVMQPEVVVINEGRMAVNTTTTTTTTTRGPRADDSSSTEEEGEEEMEGAVGGVGISDRKDFEEAQRPCITVEVEPSRLAPPIHPGVEAAVEQSAEDPDPTPTLTPTPTPTPTPSPVGEEGSINGAFLLASGSSEEDNPNNGSNGSGSGSGRGGKKKRNKQRKNNQVV